MKYRKTKPTYEQLCEDFREDWHKLKFYQKWGNDNDNRWDMLHHGLSWQELTKERGNCPLVRNHVRYGLRLLREFKANETPQHQTSLF